MSIKKVCLFFCVPFLLNGCASQPQPQPPEKVASLFFNHLVAMEFDKAAEYLYAADYSLDGNTKLYSEAKKDFSDLVHDRDYMIMVAKIKSLKTVKCGDVQELPGNLQGVECIANFDTDDGEHNNQILLLRSTQTGLNWGVILQ